MASEFRIRPAESADLPGAQAAFFAALSDLMQRHGFPPVEPPADLLPAFPHVLAHHGGGGFWVAEAADGIIAFANGILREGNWFLSGFWCLPRWQGRGVGKSLYQRMAETVSRAKAASVYASYDPPAMATYLRLGLAPRPPIFKFQLHPSRPLPPRPAWDGEVEEMSVPGARHLAELGDLDRPVRGCRRDVDHQYLASFPEARLRLYRRDGQPAAYAWVLADGRIGPVACADVADVVPVLHAAVALGAEVAGERAFLQVPGDNIAAIQWCMAHGMRVTGHTLFFSAPAFGQLDRYVIANAVLF